MRQKTCLKFNSQKLIFLLYLSNSRSRNISFTFKFFRKSYMRNKNFNQVLSFRGALHRLRNLILSSNSLPNYQLPFYELNNRVETFEKISEGSLPLPENAPANLPDDQFYHGIVNVIRCACCPLVQHRFSAANLLKFPYFAKVPVLSPLNFNL
ncbi:hypothetical protein SNEBB_007138 [Seison nebaliae]|nr:hypothetical protein SNEBB_007138 [Seison nebaliae]